MIFLYLLLPDFIFIGDLELIVITLKKYIIFEKGFWMCGGRDVGYTFSNIPVKFSELTLVVKF
jgi:hypothetical protein